MKKTFLLFILLVLFVPASWSQINGYDEGDTVDDFTVTDIFGEEHNLYSYTAEGKYVIIDFFYIGCGGCQSFISIFNELHDKYGCNEGDLVCIAMNGIDKDSQVLTFEETFGGEFHWAPAITIDGGGEDVTSIFDPMYYPACILIDNNNVLVNGDVHPTESVEDIEANFPVDFNPEVMPCSLGFADQQEELFSVYPNPIQSGEFLAINAEHNFEKANLEIYNILGNLIFKKTLNKSMSNLKVDLPKGTYLLSISNEHNSTVKKLIVR